MSRQFFIQDFFIFYKRNEATARAGVEVDTTSSGVMGDCPAETQEVRVQFS